MKLLHKGSWYWGRRGNAKRYAVKHGLVLSSNRTRIVSNPEKYELGWAVQLRPGGPYAGPWLEPPNGLTTTHREDEVKLSGYKR
jgi:hypothetical protein